MNCEFILTADSFCSSIQYMPFLILLYGIYRQNTWIIQSNGNSEDLRYGSREEKDLEAEKADSQRK